MHDMNLKAMLYLHGLQGTCCSPKRNMKKKRVSGLACCRPIIYTHTYTHIHPHTHIHTHAHTHIYIRETYADRHIHRDKQESISNVKRKWSMGRGEHRNQFREGGHAAQEIFEGPITGIGQCFYHGRMEIPSIGHDCSLLGSLLAISSKLYWSS